MKIYNVHLNMDRIVTAGSKEEALEEARQVFLQRLKDADDDFIVVEEWLDLTGKNGM